MDQKNGSPTESALQKKLMQIRFENGGSIPEYYEDHAPPESAAFHLLSSCLQLSQVLLAYCLEYVA